MKPQNVPRIISEGIILAFVLAPLAYLASIWSSLPETIPMHYNLAGEVDRYGLKKRVGFP